MATDQRILEHVERNILERRDERLGTRFDWGI